MSELGNLGAKCGGNKARKILNSQFSILNPHPHPRFSMGVGGGNPKFDIRNQEGGRTGIENKK
jgi:hypothetical protein